MREKDGGEQADRSKENSYKKPGGQSGLAYNLLFLSH